MQILQINLHHCRAATATLIQFMKKNGIDVVLIQEPWLTIGRVGGLEAAGKIWSVAVTNDLRACIVTRRGLDVTFLPQLSDNRTSAISVVVKSGGTDVTYVLAAVYCQWNLDGHPIGEKGEGIVDWCREKKAELLLGMDANAQHEIWGCASNNNRGDRLVDKMTSLGMVCLNRGNEPSYVTAARETTLDVTLCTQTMAGQIRGWRVVTETPSMSDHRYIRFCLNGARVERSALKRNPKKTDWTRYLKLVEEGIHKIPRRYGKQEEIDAINAELTSLLMNAWEDSTEERTIKNGVGKHWWTGALTMQKKEVGRLLEKARRSRKRKDWKSANMAREGFRSQVKKTEKEAWEKYCTNVASAPEASRINKALTATATGTAELGAIKRPDGQYTACNEEILELLLKEHFPGFARQATQEESRTATTITAGPSTSSAMTITTVGRADGTPVTGPDPEPISTVRAQGTRSDWPLGNQVVSLERLEWAINSFKPFKAPGPDGIYPKMLQVALPFIGRPLVNMIKACIALSIIPTEWGKTKVTFLPKPGKSDYGTPKAFRPISLTSYLLKTAEKLVDKHLKEGALKRKPIHRCQHAFRAGHSTEVALHQLLRTTEKALFRREVVVAGFMDIEGAFNQTPTNVMGSAMRRFGVEKPIRRWIIQMLANRQLVASRGSATLSGSVNRGCPQGGILTPLLWCMAVDDLVEELDSRGLDVVAYADDITFLAASKRQMIETATALASRALRITERWCEGHGLSVNPAKMEVILFNTKRTRPTISGLTYNGQPLTLVKQVKYLGVVITDQLDWKVHAREQTKKARSNLGLMHRVVGNDWGLRPKVMLWIYQAIVVPRILYGAIAWWSAVNLVEIRKELDSLQGNALRMVLGAFRTTPGRAMEVITGVVPLDLRVKETALNTAQRIKSWGHWNEVDNEPRPYNVVKVWHSGIVGHIKNRGVKRRFGERQDRSAVEHSFGNKYQVVIPERGAWEENQWLYDQHRDLVYYTDGSRKNGLTGAAWTGSTDQASFAVLRLGEVATVFQSEVYAIMDCVAGLIQKETNRRSIVICSDSQAALKALANVETGTRMVRQCKERLNTLAGLGNRVKVIWCPGHRGIEGNERADRLANEGSDADRTAMDPRTPVSTAVFKSNVREWIAGEWEKRWRDPDSGSRQTKEFLGLKPTYKRSKDLVNCSRLEARRMTGILTGHTNLNGHLQTIGVISNDKCSFCGQERETSRHILCECPALVQCRMKHLGEPMLEASTVPDKSVARIIRFLDEVNPWKSP